MLCSTASCKLHGCADHLSVTVAIGAEAVDQAALTASIIGPPTYARPSQLQDSLSAQALYHNVQVRRHKCMLFPLHDFLHEA